MIYVGINIAKLNPFAAAISSEGEILIEPFKCTNDYDGFYLLFSKLAPLNQNSIIIGLESTAHYGDNLARFLITKDFKVYVLNPVSTSSIRKNNIRKTKIDKVGTFVISKTLMVKDSLMLLTLKDMDCIELKEFGRFCQNPVYALLKEVPTQNTIASMHRIILLITQKASHGQFGKDTARELRVLAQKSVSINDSSLSIQITKTMFEMANFVTVYTL